MKYKFDNFSKEDIIICVKEEIELLDTYMALTNGEDVDMFNRKSCLWEVLIKVLKELTSV